MAEMISRLPREMEATALSNQPSGDRPFPVDLTVAACRLRHGDLLFAVSAPPSKGSTTNSSSPPAASADVLVSQLDAELDRDPGLIKRSRDSNFCRHGPNAMCDYCMPLEPYDQTYLKENKIKHLSFYSHLKQRHHQDKASRVLLEEPSFRVLPHCPTGHAPYPKSMCAKCQPSAIVLQQQPFRMVDHVEFESSAVVDEFIANWRRSGLQRFGYLYGRLCRHPDIPLGIKAVVECIYEPAQVSAVDGVELVSQADDQVDSLAQSLGLSRLGMIYSDLFDDGSGAGKVQTRRHKDSFFLSSAECVFIARKQLAHPFATAKAVGGQFGSRFVSVVVTGDANGNIQLFAYQVSNTCMAMVRDGIVDATVDARVMRVQESAGSHYVPDVFYKYKNEYGVQVQEAARPTFPVDYFVVSLSEGFPLEPNPRFKSVTKVEKPTQARDQLKSAPSLVHALSNFNMLLYLQSTQIFSPEDWSVLLGFVNEPSASNEKSLVSTASWKTFQMLLQDDGAPSSAASSAPVAEWQCRHCTFINRKRGDCEMCGLPKDA